MSTTVIDFDTALRDATTCYTHRKDRTEHPDGSTDNGGRWYPTASERQPCCDRVRSPSRAWPWSYMLHCRTVEHVAQLYGVDATALRRATRPTVVRQPPRIETRYKVVRVLSVPQAPGYVYASLYDNTVYHLDITYRQAAKPRHGGGYYVRHLQALKHDFLAGDLVGRPEPGTYAIIQCDVWGKRIEYDNRKESWTYLKPLAEIERFTVED